MIKLIEYDRIIEELEESEKQVPKYNMEMEFIVNTITDILPFEHEYLDDNDIIHKIYCLFKDNVIDLSINNADYLFYLAYYYMLKNSDYLQILEKSAKLNNKLAQNMYGMYLFTNINQTDGINMLSEGAKNDCSMCYYNMGLIIIDYDIDLAIKCFNNAIELAPRNSYAIRKISSLYVEYGKFNKALQYLSILDNKTFIDYFNIGRLFQKLGNIELAIKYYKRSEFKNAYFNLGEIYENNGDINSMIKYYTLAGDDGLTNLAIYYATHDDPSTAEKYYQELANKNNHVGFSGLALIKIQLGDKKSGKKLFTKAIELGCPISKKHLEIFC